MTPAGCTNCGTGRAGRYCHPRGQDTVPPQTAIASWRAQWQRLARTLHALLLRPVVLVVGTIVDQSMFVAAVMLTFTLA